MAIRQSSGSVSAQQRSPAAARASWMNRSAMGSEKPYSAAAAAQEMTLPHARHSRIARRTPPGRFLPCSSAQRYIAAVRSPASPTVMANDPTVRMSCNSPIPPAPICSER